MFDDIHIYASIKLIIFPTVPIHFKIITKNREAGFCLNSHFFLLFSVLFFSLLQEDTHFYILQPTNKRRKSKFSETGMPDSSIALPAALVHFFHSLHRFANAATAPIKRRRARVSRLGFPLAIYWQRLKKCQKT